MFFQLLLALVIFVLFSSPVFGQAVTLFKGQPAVKISENGISRFPEQLSHNQAVNLTCVISEIGGRYYWASRENKAKFDYVEHLLIGLGSVTYYGVAQ
jgi:hypothetical protein